MSKKVLPKKIHEVWYSPKYNAINMLEWNHCGGLEALKNFYTLEIYWDVKKKHLNPNLPRDIFEFRKDTLEKGYILLERQEFN